MLTEQEKAQIRTKIRKEQYCITLNQMKQYFKDLTRTNSLYFSPDTTGAREIDDKKTMEKIEYHLTYINFHYECGLLISGQYDKLPEVIKNW